METRFKKQQCHIGRGPAAVRAPAGTTLLMPSDPYVAAFEKSDAASRDNNYAVAMIQSGNDDKALRILLNALDDLKDWQSTSFEAELLSHSQVFHEGPKLSDRTVMALLPAAILEYRQLTISSTAADLNKSFVSIPDDRDLIYSPSNSFSVYNRAFVFVEERTSVLGWSRRMRLLPAVILFNLALIYHRKAVQTALGSNDYDLAQQYYTTALHVVNENLKFDLYTPDYSLLMLAIYNNMGFICSHFFREHETMMIAGRMLATFASMDCSRLLVKDEYVFYYMNLLFLLNRHTIFAPAA
jgi:tetratricopeptide (TPR) repeat protein